MKGKRNYNDGTTLSTRAYSWDLVIYEIETDYLLNKLDYLTSIGLVKHFAFIQHDNDKEINESGVEVSKPLHTHLLIVFNQNVSVRQIKERILEYTQHNTFGQPLKDINGAYRYLTHKDDKDKYQYDDNLIISNDNYFSKPRDLLNPNKEVNEISQMIDDYLSNVGYRTMAIKYGKDFIKNFKSYQYYFELIRQEEGTK